LAFIYFWIAALSAVPSELIDQEDLITFDKLARLFHCLWWTVRIVIGNEIDLAAVDAAGSVYLAKICRLGPAENAPSRSRPTVGHNVADLDFLVGDAGILFLLGKCAASTGSNENDGGRNAANRRATKDISFLPNEPMNVSVLLRTSNGLLSEKVNTLRQALSISTSAARPCLSVCLVRQHS
jgi:hypothetical protein